LPGLFKQASPKNPREVLKTRRNARILCAKGDLPWTPGIDQSDLVLAAIILLSDAGRIFGIDRLLGHRFPKLWIL